MIDFKYILSQNKEGIQRFVDPEKVEKKYGGNLENLSDYWPPRYIGDATKTFDEEQMTQIGIIPFTYEKEEFETYQKMADAFKRSLKIGASKYEYFSLIK